MQQVHETFLLVLIPLLYSQQPCGCAPEAGHKDGRGARGAAGRLESKLTVVRSARRETGAGSAPWRMRAIGVGCPGRLGRRGTKLGVRRLYHTSFF